MVSQVPLTTPLRPGQTIGILGGGQLGRMLALAAARYGLRVHVFGEDESPAFDVACRYTCADYEDEAALARFVAKVDVVTYEFENVPLRTAEFVAARRPLHPNAHALAAAQDRIAEKTFVSGLGIKTAPFRAVSDAAELRSALAEIGGRAVLKTRRFGYDGKGQAMIDQSADADEAWAALGGVPSVLEGFVPFEREVSVVAARGLDGSFAAFDLCANEHRNHILDVTRVPAEVSSEVESEAIAIAQRIADALDYVGVLTVELFLVARDGHRGLVVNEIAPRVHNSGHWTIEGAASSQFDQHIRAICGWPLGPTTRLGRIEMRNLIGQDIDRFAALLAEPDAHPHHYGKDRARPGRKMGHVTYVRR